MDEPLTDKELEALRVTAEYPAGVVDADGKVIDEMPNPLERRLLATIARLQERETGFAVKVRELEVRVDGMQAEGCAALGLVENIFNGLTSGGKPKLAQMAEAAAKLLTEATLCGHKALAEQRKERIARLAWLVNELRSHIEIDGHGPYAIPAHPSGCHFCHALTRTIEDVPRAAIEEEGT